MKSSYFESTAKLILLIIVLNISNAWANPSRSKQVPYSCPKDTCSAKYFETKVGKLFLIEATVNGEKGTFIFDTGTSYLALTPEFSKKINFNESIDELSRYKQVEEKTGTVFKKVSLVEVGDAQFSNVQVMVRDFDQFGEVLKVKIDGLLGGDILHRTAFKVDYSSNTLTFINDASSLDGDWYDIWVRDSQFYIPTRLYGEWHLLLLDTGASNSRLNAKLFAQVDEKQFEKKELHAKAASNKSEVRISKYKNISSVYLGGDATLPDIRFNLSTKNVLGSSALSLGAFIVDPVSKQWQFTVR